MSEDVGASDPTEPVSAVWHRLLDKLAAPMLQGALSARVLGASPAPTPLAALLEEIDETVLPRRLVLSNANGCTALLDVSNRRLLYVEIPSHGAVVAPLVLSARDLTYGGLEQLIALREGLERLCAYDTTWRVLSDASETSLEHTGVSVATLRQAWSAPRVNPAGIEPEAMETTLRDFCMENAPEVRAWVLYGPDEDATGDGEDALLDPLSRVLAEFEARPLAPQRDSAPFAILLQARYANGAVLLASQDGYLAALLVRPGSESAILSRIQSRVCSPEGRE